MRPSGLLVQLDLGRRVGIEGLNEAFGRGGFQNYFGGKDEAMLGSYFRAAVGCHPRLPGWPIIEIDSSQPILAWTTAQLGEVSSVTISFTMQNATGALRAFLINLHLACAGQFFCQTANRTYI